MSSRLDLHVHTTASDGLWSPARVVYEALARGLRYLAITDHETTQGAVEAMALARGTALEVIPGVEISVGGSEEEIDLLGYFVDPVHPDLLRFLKGMQAERRERIRAMAERLAQLGMPVPWERVLELARGDVLGRPHLARAMVEQGYVADEAEAFRRWLGRGCPAYIPRQPIDPHEVLAVIRAAGGVAALAHPGRSGLPRNLESLWRAGLVGLEVFHPDHSPADVARLIAIARIYDLIPTGGSDFHGPGPDGRILLGAMPVPEHTVERLRERCPR
ncbi:PHP domain-containing protein [Thermoflexus sp.]|uniref:PHP domain-containing protein n=1 Tax=Thermoflexus sp. TaxID=1969742 RepID=UPI0017716900|nr:PHP domain-containing protein [Thermoflexus sp.]